MINVTKTYLPPFEDYTSKLKLLWENRWITNNGQFVQELEKEIKEYLGVKHFFYCTNGTVVLQLAMKALALKGKIITTPFSYVATVNSIIWEECTPVFVDIRNDDCCIDASLIEEKITDDTVAILATHVYGLPCDIKKIKTIADKHHLKVIYDGAHAFGTVLNGTALLNSGDISTVSFHATKIFHTIEGGGICTNDDELAHKIYLFRQFGHIYDDYQSVGINAKNSEFHAAMGLCLLPMMAQFIQKRKEVCRRYAENLHGLQVKFCSTEFDVEYNHAYMPVFFKNEETVLKVMQKLQQQNIYSRRYFYPSLNTLKFVDYEKCEVSEAKSKSVLSLPLFFEISNEEVDLVCSVIKEAIF